MVTGRQLLDAADRRGCDLAVGRLARRPILRSSDHATAHAHRLPRPADARAAASLACSSDSAMDPADAAPSRAFGIWHPAPTESCTQEQHDAYAVVGQDGKRYPTWHPRDRARAVAASGTSTGAIRAGRTCTTTPAGCRSAWPTRRWRSATRPTRATRTTSATRSSGRTTWTCSSRAPGSALFTGKCDVLTKLHQGTHSKDAFTNNLHELIYHIKCSDGTEMHVTMMTAIGTPGEFVRSCDHSVHITAGTPTPANSPDGGGFRAIPDRACVEQFVLVPPGQQSNLLGAARDLGDVQQRAARRRPHAGVLQSVLPGHACRAGSTIPRSRRWSAGRSTVCYETTAGRQPRERLGVRRSRPTTARWRA